MKLWTSITLTTALMVYRTVHAYLLRKGYSISCVTVHKYMNTELQLFSITRKRKPDYEYGAPHKVFENKLHQILRQNP